VWPCWGGCDFHLPDLGSYLVLWFRRWVLSDGAVGFAAEAQGLREQLVAWRRDFHRHPEMGFQEHRSAGIIADRLGEWGYRVQTGVATTGVVGVLEGAQPGPVVMVRADMDALPIDEENDVDYRSQSPGIMHACGHDGHMAMGLGVAKLAARLRDRLNGTLKLVFQPGEEGIDGAQAMIKEGVLEDPRPDVVLVTHLFNDQPAGTVDVSAGPVMAAVDRWTCKVHGRGGHGAVPNRAADPVVATAQIISGLQTIVSRNVSPLDTAVVTVGTINGGEAFNIIPERVDLSGTLRTFEEEVRDVVVRRLREIAEGVATACGVTANLGVDFLSPAVVNDAAVAAVVRSAAEAVVGTERTTTGGKTMSGEDATYFMQDIPGCYFFTGSANAERGLDAPHHNPHFDFDEDVLAVGVAVLLNAAAHYLMP
jgi:amidohydrolase